MLKNIVKLTAFALPISASALINMMANFVAMFMVAKLGASELAAGAPGVSTYITISMIVMPIFYAVGILISHHKGRGENVSGISEIVRNGFWIALIFSIPNYLIHAFVSNDDMNNKKEIIHLAVIFMGIAGIMLFLDGIRNLLSGGLRGLQDSKAPMLIGILCLWLVSIPLCYIAAFDLNGGPIGLRLGFMSGFLVAAIILWMRMSAKTNGLDQENFPRIIHEIN